MGSETNFVVKKRSTWLSVLKAVLIIAAIAFVAYKVYDRFFRKKVQQTVLDGETPDALADLDEDMMVETENGELMEASAADVLVDAE